MPVFRISSEQDLTQFWEVFEKASQRRLFLKWTLSGRWCLLCILKGEVIQGKVGRREKDIWGRKYNVQDTHVLVSTSWLFVGVVQSLSHVQIFATSWTAVCQVSLPFTTSQSLLKFMSTESVTSSNHLIFCHLLLFLPSIFPSISVFPMCQLFVSGGQSIGASVSASVLPKDIWADFLQDWSPCFSKDSQDSSPEPQFEIINSLVLSLLYSPTPTSIHAYWKNHSFDYMDLWRQSYVSAF